jgi:hypothetical protein
MMPSQGEALYGEAGKMRLFIRVSTGLAILAATCLGLVVASVTPSSASNQMSKTRPTLSPTQAAFVIPASPSGEWTLKLWTLPKPSTLVGKTSGTSGTLTLPVPQTASCQFQVDVRLSVGGVSKFYSGLIATVPGCGRSGSAPRLTPGFWKNHQAQTQALLPQSLGSFVVNTASEATAIFKAMKCSDAVDCLAGHLLSAELDVANGSSICISGVIFQANHFLMSVGYSGPGSYTITSSDRATALGFETTLDDYTSDTSSASC